MALRCRYHTAQRNVNKTRKCANSIHIPHALQFLFFHARAVYVVVWLHFSLFPVYYIFNVEDVLVLENNDDMLYISRRIDSVKLSENIFVTLLMLDVSKNRLLILPNEITANTDFALTFVCRNASDFLYSKHFLGGKSALILRSSTNFW